MNWIIQGTISDSVIVRMSFVDCIPSDYAIANRSYVDYGNRPIPVCRAEHRSIYRE
ncbi:hypothetical protein [Methyloglobulus morosus]|uniref:hypothetical protein n=1 Tax=Methyloglobulus morosus TaxID=1410681 RepID=UPI001F2D2308|nr:hypothetical protein [Methyloglobulus morosus]